MSGRIRTVKPEWLEDELLAAASDEARVLSVALMLMADDYGRGRASLATVAAGAWRYQLERDDGAHAPEILARASRALRELVAIRFVTVYEVSGQRYFAIRTWAKHQRVDRPSKPRIPEPPTAETLENTHVAEPSRVSREDVASVSRGSQESLATDLRSPISDLRPVPPTTERGSERAPESAARIPLPEADPVESALRTGYARRYQAGCRDAWLTSHRDAQDVTRAAAWAKAQPEPMEAVERFLGGAFAHPPWARSRWPWKWLAEDPGLTASRSSMAVGTMGGATTMDDAMRAKLAAIPTLDLDNAKEW